MTTHTQVIKQQQQVARCEKSLVLEKLKKRQSSLWTKTLENNWFEKKICLCFFQYERLHHLKITMMPVENINSFLLIH